MSSAVRNVGLNQAYLDVNRVVENVTHIAQQNKLPLKIYDKI